MIHSLVGYVSLGVTSDTILMPLFTRPGQNGVFVQDLDVDFRVLRFLALDIEGYEGVVPEASGIEKVVGDAGHLALRLPDGEILSGEIDFIKKKLEAEPEVGSPFFRMEVAALIKEKERFNSATLDAASLFWNDNVRSVWYRTSAASVSSIFSFSKSKMKTDQYQLELDYFSQYTHWLSENFSAVNWDLIWVKAWKRSRNKKQLVDLAVNWLERQSWSLTLENESLPVERGKSSKVGRVLLHILRDWRYSSSVSLYVVNWLRYSEPNPNVWLQVWSLVFTKNRGVALSVKPPAVWQAVDLPASFFEQIAVDKLQQYSQRYLVYGEKVSARYWSSVWKQLDTDARSEEELLHLAEFAFQAFKMQYSYMVSVVLYCCRNFSLTRSFVEKISAWLYEVGGGDPLSMVAQTPWAELFMYVIRRNDVFDVNLFNLGVQWLNNCHPNLNAWVKVWATLEEIGKEARIYWAANDVAIRWMKRASIEMSGWTEVLMVVVRSDEYSADALNLAGRWLQFHGDGHPSAEIVERYISKYGINKKDLEF